MATITSGSRSGGGKTFTVGDTVYFTNYSTTLNGGAGSNSGYTMPWHGKITQLYDTTYTNWVFTSSNADANGKTSAYTMLIRPSWCTKGYKITVTYNKNGGSSGTASQTGYVGASLTGTASRTGYNFAGWYTAASGGSKVTTIPSSAKTYYAHWTAKPITIKYNANGGSGTMSDSTGSYGTAITLRANTFTRSGYTFAGWATSSTGSKVYNNQQSVTNINTGGTTTLYAVWIQSAATITFNANGGTGSNYTQQVSQGVSTALSPCIFTRTGYHLSGWAESSSGVVAYSDSGYITIPSGTSSKTLYAIWAPNEYRVKYYGAGGYGKMDDQLFAYDEQYSLRPNAFIRPGYTFKEWALFTEPKVISDSVTSSEGSTEGYNELSVQLCDSIQYIYSNTGEIYEDESVKESGQYISRPNYNNVSKSVSVVKDSFDANDDPSYMYLDAYCLSPVNIIGGYITCSSSDYTVPGYDHFVSFEGIQGEDIDNDIIGCCSFEIDPWIIDLDEDTCSASFRVYVPASVELTGSIVNTKVILDTAETDTIDPGLSLAKGYTVKNNKQTVSNLTSEQDGTIYLVAVWQKNADYDPQRVSEFNSNNTRIYDRAIYYLGSQVYPVGHIEITDSNVNPGTYLGGEWELVNKLLKTHYYSSVSEAGITFNTTNTQNGSGTIMVYPTIIQVRLAWAPKVAFADSTLSIATIDWTKVGVNSVYANYTVTANDGAGYLIMMNNSGTGMNSVDVLNTGTATSMTAQTSAGYPRDIRWFNWKNTIDSFCDRFYWKRIS